MVNHKWTYINSEEFDKIYLKAIAKFKKTKSLKDKPIQHKETNGDDQQCLDL